MVPDPQVRRRTGGRSARVRAAVHQAVVDLLAGQDAGQDGGQVGGQDGGQLSIAEVAARAGVHPTSIYRRYGSIEALVLEVALARVEAESPLPDTGALRGDLLAYATQAAADLGRPGGLAFLRAAVAAADTPPPAPGADAPASVLLARGAHLQAMLDRARERGEQGLHYTDVLDVVLAPVYLRTLFGVGGVDGPYLASLVDRLLALPPGG